MDYIERYVYAVGKRLPTSLREDIEKELKSAIYDALDARTNGNEPTEDDISEVLKTFGNPSDVANNYLGRGKSLIGPKVFDLYYLVVRIAVGASVLGVTISMVVKAVTDGMVPADISMWIAELFSSVLSAVGMVTIIFAIIDRTTPSINYKRAKDFDIKDLRPIPAPVAQIKKGSIIADIIFTVIALMLLNFFPQFVGMYVNNDNGIFAYSPIINTAVLGMFLPWITTIWVFSIINKIVLLKRERYGIINCIAEILLSLGTIVIMIFMVKANLLVGIENLTLEKINNLSDLANQGYKIVIAVIIIFSIVHIVKNIVKICHLKISK